jgi:anthraniloyl-CoA monooxygenase
VKSRSWGGARGLYLAILLSGTTWPPGHRVRAQPLDDTFGFGVVFSDETLENVGEADPETNQAMAAAAARWEDIEIHYSGTVMRSTGHRFSGVERKTLLELLAGRARSLGVEVHWRQEIRDLSDCGLPDADLIVAADGAASLIRERLADQFQPHLDWRHNRFVWLGSTRPFPAFTFYFKPSPAGSGAPIGTSTPRAARPSSSRPGGDLRGEAGSARTTSRATVAYLEELFKDELQGHPLLANRSIWRRFPTVRNARWHAGNVACWETPPTRRTSRWAGTKLAMEDAIALAAALRSASVPDALAAYGRPSPQVEPQRRGQPRWFESAGATTPAVQFADLLTHSLRITHENLRCATRRWWHGWTAGSREAAKRAGASSARLPRSSPPTGSASWCCPTGSWSPRCVSTGRWTACPTTGTWFTSAAGRSAARGW